jgi:hypothetical protein
VSLISLHHEIAINYIHSIYLFIHFFFIFIYSNIFIGDLVY